MPETLHTDKIIIGCGFLGSRLLKLLAPGDAPVWGTSRHADKVQQINSAGGRGVLFDLDEPAGWEALSLFSSREAELYFLLPPSQLNMKNLRRFMNELQAWPLRRVVMSSSTVVYGSAARCVNADSPVSIDNERAQRQYDIEALFHDCGHESRIVRLAGLYGPDRVIGRQGLLAARQVKGNPASYLNLIHVHDAARLLLQVMGSDTAAKVELGCAGPAVLRGTYYSDLADYLACPAPVFETDRPDKDMGRQCDNRLTLRRTGWQPLYADYKSGWESDQ